LTIFRGLLFGFFLFPCSAFAGFYQNSILNTNSLQAGATFYVTSGTAANFNTTNLKFNDGTVMTSSPTASSLGVVSGFGGANQVAVFNSGSSVTGISTFTYNVASGQVNIGNTDSSGKYTFTTSTGSAAGIAFSLDVSTTGHISFQNTQPVISSCGSVPNGIVVGSDISGTITVGGGVVTACTITFFKPWVNTPTCMVGDNSASITASVTSITNLSATFSTSATLGGGKIYYQCFGSD
jgi:hypothetical protein